MDYDELLNINIFLYKKEFFMFKVILITLLIFILIISPIIFSYIYFPEENKKIQYGDDEFLIYKDITYCEDEINIKDNTNQYN